jgi:DNA-binding NarL/FixJ family response regulator
MPTMLIVDDHAAFRAQARALLARDGFTVIGEAVDGAEAISSARRLRPDVVLLDIGLPDLDGFAVAERLMAHDPRITVVLTSSRSADTYRFRLRTSAAAGYVAKEDVSGPTVRGLMGGR